MSATDKVFELIKNHDVQYVDFRFTDPRGKWQHTAQALCTIDEDTFVDGIMFDGSSIAGWKDIAESDMCLLPEPESAVLDPFSAQVSLILFCDVLEPTTGQAYSRDPRSAAKRAEAYLKSSGIGDAAFFGPELEFFVFDDVRFDVSMSSTFYAIDEQEGPYNAGRAFDHGNTGHRPAIKGGYFPVPPVDSMADIRAEMLTVMAAMGVEVESTTTRWRQARTSLGSSSPSY